jgi:serine phosphatase RsbU (regulator of sigma subunit)
MFIFSIQPDGRGEFISAGHNPAFVYRAASGKIEELPSNNMILGAFDFASFESSSFSLDPKDILFVYSDGLTEAEDPTGEMFGEERVKDLVRREAPSGSEHLYKATLSAIQEFTRGRAQTDDITIIIAQRQ